MKKYLFIFFILALSFRGSVHAQHTDNSLHTLIVFFDGLRPDYITPDLMPNVYALKSKGSYGLQHHSVFPTVTRVNAASYATGSYPRTHGLMGNAVYFPSVDNAKPLNTGDASQLMRIHANTGEQLLTSVSLGELLQRAGQRFMVFSSGSTGQAFLQNHTVSGGVVVNPDLILPASFREEVLKTIGPPPTASPSNVSRHEWATNAFLHYTLSSQPLVSAIWYSDPDGAAHAKGVGSPAALESIKTVDRQFGRIISALEGKGLLPDYNIIISTDHGFVTYIGKNGLRDFLVTEGLKKDKQSDDVVVAGRAIYIKDHDKKKIRKIAARLQREEWVGAVFSKASKTNPDQGWVNGTLSFKTINWNHPTRAADLLVDYNWTDDTNAYGYKGASYSKGVAGHGSSSPYEVHIPLIAYGPSFKKNYESRIPTSNIDIVPTILKIHGLQVPDDMDGRVMNELLAHNIPTDAEVKKEVIETSAKFQWGTYHLTLKQSLFGPYRYVDQTSVTRELRAK